MEFISRLKTGIAITKDSILVLQRNPKLIFFPILNALTGLVFLLISGFITLTVLSTSSNSNGIMLLSIPLIYILFGFISLLFTGGLVHQVGKIYAGNTASIRKGLSASWDKKQPLFIWAVVSFSVGYILDMFEDNSAIRKFVSDLFGFAWKALNFFIVPVIMFEKTSTIEMFKQSGKRLKQTFGETPASIFGIYTISIILIFTTILFTIIFLYLEFIVFALFILFGGILTTSVIHQTLKSIARTTLYFYATKGQKPSEFDDIDFDKLVNKEH